MFVNIPRTCSPTAEIVHQLKRTRKSSVTDSRAFLLERISEYSAETGYPADSVLNKRLIGLALGAFIL